MFWDNFYNLCKKNGVTPAIVVRQLDIAGGMTTKWKNGAIPNGEMLLKLADYFNVSTDYLLGRTDDLQNKDNLKYALFHGSDGITDEMYEEVLRFAEFVKEKYNKNKGE